MPDSRGKTLATDSLGALNSKWWLMPTRRAPCNEPGRAGRCPHSEVCGDFWAARRADLRSAGHGMRSTPPPRPPMRCVWHADEAAHGRPRVSRYRASNRTGEGRPDARPRRLEDGAVERCSCGECARRFADGPDFEGPPYAEDAVPPAPRGAAGNTAAGLPRKERRASARSGRQRLPRTRRRWAATRQASMKSAASSAASRGGWPGRARENLFHPGRRSPAEWPNRHAAPPL